MLVEQPAPAVKVDIRSIVERPTSPVRARSPTSPSGASISSKSSGLSHQSKQNLNISPFHPRRSTDETPVVPSPLPRIITDYSGESPSRAQHVYRGGHGDRFTESHARPLPHYPPVHAYPFYHPTSAPDIRLPPIPITHALPSNKRVASPHPTEMPAKKKQSKWTAAEDASIIQLRGNGMKWDDISKHLPGRSAISCRLRFQNYLERRAEWDEEKKNKLARLYERFKKDMWEKIAKEMQLPWRAAEAMHWQIGEVEMANRANVNVFHLAGQQQQTPPDGSGSVERSASTSPRSAGGPYRPASAGGFYHTHTHSLPHMHFPHPAPLRPHEPTHLRRSSVGHSSFTSLRPRADSARSVSTLPTPPARTILPPMGDFGSRPPDVKVQLPPAAPTHTSRPI